MFQTIYNQLYLIVIEKKLLFLLFLVKRPAWIFDLTHFYNSETMECDHALHEI